VKIILAIFLLIFIACDKSEDPVEIVPIVTLPEPSLEMPRPVVNTDATYYSFLKIEDIPPRKEWKPTADLFLEEMMEAGIDLRDAWVTKEKWYWPAYWRLFIVLRLSEPDTALHDFGFVDNPPYDWSRLLEYETLHYRFDSSDEPALPGPALELHHDIQHTSSTVYKVWQPYWRPPTAHGIESYLRTLIEEGVRIKNAWAPGEWRTWCDQWGAYVLVLEVDEVTPILSQSGFKIRPNSDYNCGVPVFLNYCFELCPEVEIPEAQPDWYLIQDMNRRMYLRSFLSEEYEETISHRTAADHEVQRLVRGGVELLHAWVPTNGSSKPYTHILIELKKPDYRILFFGYDKELDGGWGDLDWEVIWYYRFVEPDEPEEIIEAGIDMGVE
jgi:hypothetical protein